MQCGRLNGVANVLCCLGLAGALVMAGLARSLAQDTAKKAVSATDASPEKEENTDFAAEIDALTKKVKEINDKKLTTAVENLAKALKSANCVGLTVDPKDAKKECFDAYIKAADAAIPENLSPAQRLAVTKIMEDLKARLDKDAGVVPADFINVLGAYYGDIDAIGDAIRLYGRPGGQKDAVDVERPKSFENVNSDQYQNTPMLEAAAQSSDRFCTATQAIRTLCHGKDNCLDTTVASPPALNGSNLCGYEPAPYADPQNKGLVVVYQCLDKVKFENDQPPDKASDKASDKKKEFPFSRSWLPKRSKDFEQRWAFQRANQSSRITCFAPAKAAAAAPAVTK